MFEFAGGNGNASAGAIGGDIDGTSGRFISLSRIASRKLPGQPKPVCGAHVVMGVQAISPGSAGLSEVGTAAVIIGLSLGSTGHVEESCAEAERHRDTATGTDVGPIDGCTVVTA